MNKICSRVVIAAVAASLGAGAALAQGTPQEISITSKSQQAVETFKKGRELLDNIRVAEATVEFQKAVDLDPDFGLAHAYLASVTPGAAAKKILERAGALAPELPQAERLVVDYLVAQGRGEDAHSRELAQKLVEVAPGDWHAHYYWGTQLYGERNFDGAITALKRATELHSKAGAPFNILGYVYLEQEKHEAAIESFKKYAALCPTEPNPHDSLAEALLAAGRFEESEAAFRKAVEVAPSFHIAWMGVAQTRFLRADWPGGFEAVAKARAAAPRPIDKLFTDFTKASCQLAQGRTAEALATLDVAEKEATQQKLDLVAAFAPLNRATLLLRTGKPADALPLIELGLKRGDKAALPGGEMNALRRSGLEIQVEAEAKLSRADAARKTQALIAAEAAKDPSSDFLRTRQHFGAGMVALAGADAKGAVEHLAQCPKSYSYYRYQLALAQERAGDKAAAAATRKELLGTKHRDSDYLYVHSLLVAAGESGLTTRK